MSFFRTTFQSIVDLRSQVSSAQELLGEENPALQTLQKVEAEVKQCAEKLQQTQPAMDGFRKRANETDPEQRCYGPKMKAKVNDLCKIFDSLQVDVMDILSLTRDKIAKELSVKAEAEAAIAAKAAAEKADAEKAVSAHIEAEKAAAEEKDKTDRLISADEAAAARVASEKAAAETEKTELLTKLRLGIAEFKIMHAPTAAELDKMMRVATRRNELTATLFGSVEFSSNRVDALLHAFKQLKQIAPDMSVLYYSESTCDLPSYQHAVFACTKEKLAQSVCIHNGGDFVGHVSLTGSTFSADISKLLDGLDATVCKVTSNSVSVDRNVQPITLSSCVTTTATASSTSTTTTGECQSVYTIFQTLDHFTVARVYFVSDVGISLQSPHSSHHTQTAYIYIHTLAISSSVDVMCQQQHRAQPPSVVWLASRRQQTHRTNNPKRMHSLSHLS